MAYSIIKREQNPNTGRDKIEAVAGDASSDLTALGSMWCPGSVANVINTSGLKVYMLGADAAWREVI